jgi:hypothetical protein
MIHPNRATVGFALTIALALTGALLGSVQSSDDAQFALAYVQINSLPQGDSSAPDNVRNAFDRAPRVQVINPAPTAYDGVRSAMIRALQIAALRASLAR